MCLRSQRAVDQLRIGPDDDLASNLEWGLHFSSGAPPAPDSVLYRWGGRYGLTLAKLDGRWLFSSELDGVFLIDPSLRVIRCFIRDSSSAVWLDVLVRRVLPRVAILAGASAIHAAALATPHGAVLLLGRSGAGKSTLSAALGHAGWDILSDDISVIWNPAAPEIAPATTGVCVWRDSRDALALQVEHCAPMPAYDGKFRYSSGNDTGVSAQPLRAFVFLMRSGDVETPVLRRLAASEGLIRIAQQRIRFNPADGKDETLTMFERLRSMVGAVPCYGLDYPGDYAALPRVETLLHQLVPA